MPNHVTTILRAPTEVIHALMTEEGVDFNRVIPMPDDVIQHPTGYATIDGEKVKAYYIPDPDQPDNQIAHIPVPFPEGAIDWYEWSIANWGTKWNAYDHELSEDDTVLRFDTAWSHPFPVIKQLSRLFPTEIIQVVYADEDLGNNLGGYMIKGGDIAWVPTPAENTPAAADFASLIKYGVKYDDLNTDEPHVHFDTVTVVNHLSLHTKES